MWTAVVRTSPRSQDTVMRRGVQAPVEGGSTAEYEATSSAALNGESPLRSSQFEPEEPPGRAGGYGRWLSAPAGL